MNTQPATGRKEALETFRQEIRQAFINVAGSGMPLDDLCYIVDFITRGLNYRPRPTAPAGGVMSQEEKMAYDRFCIELHKAFVKNVGFGATTETVFYYMNYFDTLKEDYLSCPALRSFLCQVYGKVQTTGGAA